MHRTSTANRSHAPAILLPLLASVLLLSVACNAPRDNVLDPNSPYYIGVDPRGEDDVTRYYDLKVTTQHFEGDLSTLPYDQITTIIRVVDPDIIQDVQLEIENGFRFKMERLDSSNVSSRYSYIFKPGNFGYSIHDFANVPFYVFAYDRKGYVRRSKDATYVRVLTQNPVLVYPGPPDTQGNVATVETRPLFQWTQDTSPYPNISYHITIWQQTGEEYILWKEEGGIDRVILPGSTTDSYQLTSPLPPDTLTEYYVRIRTDDQFGNQRTGPIRSFFVGYDQE